MVLFFSGSPNIRDGTFGALSSDTDQQRGLPRRWRSRVLALLVSVAQRW